MQGNTGHDLFVMYLAGLFLSSCDRPRRLSSRTAHNLHSLKYILHIPLVILALLSA